MTDSAMTQDRIAFLRRLRAIRQFRPDPVLPEALDDILTVARWSGSASNRQPWELIVVRDRATLQQLAGLEGYAKHLAGAPLGIALVMAGERAEQETFDEGRLSERIMLAAAAHGLGASIGWLTGSGREAAKALLGVPPERTLRTIIAVGYPTEAALSLRTRPGEARKPLAEVVRQERYR